MSEMSRYLNRIGRVLKVLVVQEGTSVLSITGYDTTRALCMDADSMREHTVFSGQITGRRLCGSKRRIAQSFKDEVNFGVRKTPVLLVVRQSFFNSNGYEATFDEYWFAYDRKTGNIRRFYYSAGFNRQIELEQPIWRLKQERDLYCRAINCNSDRESFLIEAHR